MTTPARERSGSVLIVVQHLRGIGHIVRMSRIAEAIAQSGLAVTYVMGGARVENFMPAGANIIELPPLKAAPGTFRTLHTPDGTPPDEAYKARRFAQLREALEQAQPEIVIIEAFPFDRPQMHFEFVPFVELAASVDPRPLIACSIRDILQRKDKPERDATALEILNRHFDHVLVHGDPTMAQLHETFPHVQQLRPKVHYTGIVSPPSPTAPDETFDVIVSHGGGAFGAHVLETAIAAKPLSQFADARWLAIEGVNLAAPDRERIAALAEANGVTLRRFVPNLSRNLAVAQVSVSQGGYNTVADILRARCPAVICPDTSIRQNEQPMRAHRLAERGLAVVVEEAVLNPKKMAAAIDEAARQERPEQTIDLEGAAATARLVSDLISAPVTSA